MNFAAGKIPLGGKSPKNVYILYLYSLPAQETAKQRQCSNEAKMRNLLKFAGVPQTPQQISAVSGPKFTILWKDVELKELLSFNKFFPIVDT